MEGGGEKLIYTQVTVDDFVDNIKDTVDSIDNTKDIVDSDDSISSCDSAPCLAVAGAGRDSRDWW